MEDVIMKCCCNECMDEIKKHSMKHNMSISTIFNCPEHGQITITRERERLRGG